MRSKREHHEKSTLDRKPKRLKNVDSIKSAFIFVLGSQKSIFPDCPFYFSLLLKFQQFPLLALPLFLNSKQF